MGSLASYLPRKLSMICMAETEGVAGLCQCHPILAWLYCRETGAQPFQGRMWGHIPVSSASLQHPPPLSEWDLWWPLTLLFLPDRMHSSILCWDAGQWICGDTSPRAAS